MRKTQHGVAHYGLLAVLALVFVGVGFFAWQTVAKNQPAGDTVSGTVKVAPELPAAINDNKDVKQAAAALDESSVEQLDPSVLDEDLNALL